MSLATFHFNNRSLEIVLEGAASLGHMRRHSIVDFLAIVAETCRVQLVVRHLTAKTVILLILNLFFDVSFLICSGCSTIKIILNICFKSLQLGEYVNIFII